MVDKQLKKSIRALFSPKNIVILNASEKLWYFIEGLEEQQFPREKIFLINPKLEKLFGQKCYQSVHDIPVQEIDHMILAIRRDQVIKTLSDVLMSKKVKAVHIFSAGMAESDEKGKQIESQLKELLEKYEETRAIGPNCMGVYCPKGRIGYNPQFPSEAGNIGLIFQSGDLHTKMIKFGDLRHNLRFSKGVSVGNCIDLQVSNFLKYMDNDSETEIICVYFEGFSKFHPSEGKVLFNTLKNLKKPVLFLRGGITERAQNAVLTHTGSIATTQTIWNAIYQQVPIIKIGSSLDDLLDHAYIFYKFYEIFSNPDKSLPYPVDKRALVILWSGGFGILATDTLSELNMKLPLFKGEKLARLKQAFPLKIGSLSNPLDLPWIVHTPEFLKICKVAIDDEIDIVFIESDAYTKPDSERFQGYYQNLKQIKAHIEGIGKLLVIILPEYPGEYRKHYYEMLMRDNFIVYPSLKRAAKAFLSLYEYGIKRNNLS